MAAKKSQGDVMYERKATPAETKKYRNAMSIAASDNEREAWRHIFEPGRKPYKGVVQGDGNLAVPFGPMVTGERGVDVSAKRNTKPVRRKS